VLHTGGQLQIVNPGWRSGVEDFADAIKLDEIPTQRAAQEGFALEAE
jgi:hypothetical protein